MADDFVPEWAQQPAVTVGTQGQPRILISPPKDSDYVPLFMRDRAAPAIAPTTTGATNPAIDFAKSFPGGVVSGLSGVLSASGQAAQAEMGQPIDVPSPQQTEAALQQNVTGQLPLPQGTGGQYGRSVGQFLATAPFSPPIPGVGPISAGIGAVGAGLASETAGQAAAGTPFESAARIAAPVLGGLLTRRAAPVSEAEALKVGSQTAEAPTTAQLLSTGAQQMEAGRAAGTNTFSPGTMQQLVSNIENVLKSNNSRDYRAPQTFRAVQELGNETTAGGIQNVRSLIGDIGKEGGHEGYAARLAQGEIDSFLKNAEPAAAEGLAEGRANYAAGMRSKESDLRSKIAELKTNRAGYGGNARAVNAIKQTLFPVVKKWMEGEKNGISADEFQAMYDIVHGTTTTNTLRGLGMISPEKGSLPVAILAETAKELGPEIAGAMAGGSWLSNKLANVMTTAQINRLNEMIRKRSPLYEKAVKDAADRYTQSMNDFAANPSQQLFVKALVASRNLSAGFRKDGIPLSSGDLLKGLKAPDNTQGNENQ